MDGSCRGRPRLLLIQWSEMTKTQEQVRQTQYARITRLRQEWIDANGPCQECGSTERLEIDHIDPTTKDPDLQVRNMWYWNKVRREAELVKCQVLCVPCHDAKTLLQNRKEACPQGHPYTPENIVTFPGRPNTRECRTCRNEYNRNLRRRNRARYNIQVEVRKRPCVVFT